MGEVYRARDTRLQRDVALKILPDAFASDAERLARFEREAQVLASLNHPNIAAIHGLEESPGEAGHQVRALVLELVEGETLADRLVSGALPLDEVLSIARQIADALEAAHEQGIVHRDLKPANIKVRPDGTVKVLDFGLAKLAQAPGPGPQASVNGLTVSPTITTPAMTQMGVIMGTAAYMSPEQAKGREADKRSDVWSFGAVLYELLTARRAFDGEDMSDTLASVLKIDPDWTRLPADVPHAVRTLMQRCLVKDRRQRVSEISTAKFILSELGNIGGSQAATTRALHDARPRSLWRRVLPPAAAVVLTAAIVGAAAGALRPAPRPAPFSQFSFTLPGAFMAATQQQLAISPDGTRLAYGADSRVYLRPIGELEPHEVAGTLSAGLGVGTPLFAPDGQSIAFFSLAGSTDGRTGVTLKRIPITGGAPLTLATTDFPVGASWGPNGILIGQGRGGIVRVSPNGGTPERIVGVGADEEAHGPQMLPDGRTVLYTLAKDGGSDRWDQAKVVAESLVDGTRRILREGASDARYLPSGHLLYVVGGTMFAVPFDDDSLATTGDPVPVVVGVRRSIGGRTGSADLAVSDTGTVVYRPGPATTSTTRNLVVGDNRGEPTPLKVPPALYSHPRVSVDGTLLAVGRSDGQGSNIWIYELSGKTEIRRVTFEGNNRFPVWSADRRVAFQSDRGGNRAVWWQSADGGRAEPLTKPGQGEEHIPEAWSPDGKHMLFSVLKESAYSLWVLTLEVKKVEPFGDLRSNEPFGANFAPDGRWVVYAATAVASGIVSPDRGVFVEPFPHRPGEKHQLTNKVLDYHPRWAPEGGSIYYVPAAARAIVSVPVTTQPSITFGSPVDLERAPRPGLLSVDTRGYDVLRGGRFVSVVPAFGDSAVPTTELRVMLNWFEELKRLAPPK
jgi:serine/threonine-protein kinase